jgi:hypothetical protein
MQQLAAGSYLLTLMLYSYPCRSFYFRTTRCRSVLLGSNVHAFFGQLHAVPASFWQYVCLFLLRLSSGMALCMLMELLLLFWAVLLHVGSRRHLHLRWLCRDAEFVLNSFVMGAALRCLALLRLSAHAPSLRAGHSAATGGCSGLFSALMNLLGLFKFASLAHRRWFYYSSPATVHAGRSHTCFSSVGFFGYTTGPASHYECQSNCFFSRQGTCWTAGSGDFAGRVASCPYSIHLMTNWLRPMTCD